MGIECRGIFAWEATVVPPLDCNLVEVVKGWNTVWDVDRFGFLANNRPMMNRKGQVVSIPKVSEIPWGKLVTMLPPRLFVFVHVLHLDLSNSRMFLPILSS